MADGTSTRGEVRIEITRFSDTKLKVSPDRAVAIEDTEPKIRWVAHKDLEIQYIGFNGPVGGDNALGIPHPDPANLSEWIAENKNSSKDLFSYCVWAKLSDGRVISTDPQIENEGKGGGDGEIEPPKS